MAGYNLDEKSGFLGVFNKTSLKVIKVSSDVEMKHYNVFNNLRAIVDSVNDPVLKLVLIDSSPDLVITPRDFIVLSYTDSNDVYLLSCSVLSIDIDDPKKFSVTTIKIEKLKDLRKAERFFISQPAYIKVQGIIEPIFAIATNISVNGLKAVCSLNLLLEDIMDITVVLNKNEKLNFRGKIVRKNRIMDLYEYGFEMYELSENNRRNLHHYVNQFSFGNNSKA
ncbi:MAG: PilZ domain-containing protein [Bacillota bacterium]|nr:PilZ domain-containing protein [Bacillota bacterium]